MSAMKEDVWGTCRMIEHHKNGAFNVLIAWSTHLKSICFSCGIRSMPLETRIFFLEKHLCIDQTNLNEMIVRAVEILVQFDDQTSKERGEFSFGFALIVSIGRRLDKRSLIKVVGVSWNVYVVHQTTFDTHFPVLNLFVIHRRCIRIETNRILMTDEYS